jgi:acetyl esterase
MPPDASFTCLPGMIFSHPGGLVTVGIDTHDALCRLLCNKTGCQLIAAEYRLASEHVFPAAIEDANAATVWVIGQVQAQGVDPRRIVVAGDPAGGARRDGLPASVAPSWFGGGGTTPCSA